METPASSLPQNEFEVKTEEQVEKLVGDIGRAIRNAEPARRAGNSGIERLGRRGEATLTVLAVTATDVKWQADHIADLALRDGLAEVLLPDLSFSTLVRPSYICKSELQMFVVGTSSHSSVG